jgi:hypothetical protein
MVETGYYSLQFSTLQTENKMSRHTSQPNCLNFYPTAPRRWRFGYHTLHTFAFAQPHKADPSQKQKSAILLTHNFFADLRIFVYFCYTKSKFFL